MSNSNQLVHRVQEKMFALDTLKILSAADVFVRFPADAPGNMANKVVHARRLRRYAEYAVAQLNYWQDLLADANNATTMSRQPAPMAVRQQHQKKAFATRLAARQAYDIACHMLGCIGRAEMVGGAE